MSVDSFQKLLEPVTDFVSSEAVDSALTEKLNRRFPHYDETFKTIEAWAGMVGGAIGIATGIVTVK